MPDPPEALTSSAGWDCKNNLSFLQNVIGRLKENGVRTSIFLNPDIEQVPYAADTGTDRIELYTESYASSFGKTDQEEVFELYKSTAEAATAHGMGVNAGHDLNQLNLAYFNDNISGLLEVSIGHALVVEMLYQGMYETIKNYLEILGH